MYSHTARVDGVLPTGTFSACPPLPGPARRSLPPASPSTAACRPLPPLARRTQLPALPPQVLFSFFSKLAPGLTPPARLAPRSLGTEAHSPLICGQAEYRLVSFCLHVLRDYLATQETAMSGGNTASLAAQALLPRPSPPPPHRCRAVDLSLAAPDPVSRLPHGVPRPRRCSEQVLHELTPSVVILLQGILDLHECQVSRTLSSPASSLHYLHACTHSLCATSLVSTLFSST